MIQPKTRVTWCVVRGGYDDGDYIDVVTDYDEATAREIHARWQHLITPEREFHLVKRTISDEPVPTAPETE